MQAENREPDLVQRGLLGPKSGVHMGENTVQCNKIRR